MDWTIEETKVSGEPAKVATRADGAKVRPIMTPAGYIRYQAWSPKRGLIATDRGNPKNFTSLAAAQRSISA